MAAEKLPGRAANLIICGLVGALAALLPLIGRRPFGFLFWLLTGGLVLALVLDVRRQRRRARLAAWRAADPGHFLVDTTCHLDWARLGAGLDEAAAQPLRALLQTRSRDLRDLKPLVRKALVGLKKNLRRRPGEAGAWAYRAFCLALYGQIVGREAQADNLGEFPGARWGGLSRKAYARAAELAEGEAGIQADWGRNLEVLALSLEALSGRPEDEEARAARLAALAGYEKAAGLDPECYPAWRGLGRLLSREALLADQPEKARILLVRAVDAYETARRARPLEADFHHEFGQAVFELAQLSENQGDHYCRYAARLFILAAEEGGDDPEALFMAGRALAQAAARNEGRRPETARELYREALDFLKQAAGLNPEDSDSRREAARCLTGLFHLSPPAERPEGRGGAFRLLEEAAAWAARAAEIAPGEEVLAGWADILSSLAEYSEEARAGRFWEEAARQYGRAAKWANVPDERAAANWHNWGYALSALAETKASPSRRRKLLKLAARKYERAAALNGDNLVTLENWGDTLGDLAGLAADPAEAARFREQAVAKYREAARLYPGQAGPWRHWSAFNQTLAREEKNPARRRELWQAALNKLEEAARINPEEALTWVLWGRLLMELFGEGPEYERPLLVAGAIEKFERALTLDRGDGETWSRLGRVRLEAAELADEFNFNGGPLNNALLAGEHFKTACDLNPAESEYWADWGRALFRLSQIIDNEASCLSALKEAHEKYLTAVALDPADGELHTGLGHVLYQWGWRIEDTAAKEDRFKKAYEHCGEAGRLAPHDPNVWRNWARVTEALAFLEDDPHKSSAWQNEADEKYYQADILEAPGPRTSRH
ncbi:MAG: hypothetical protein LBV21_06560 [Candidatus Adiutrix sp.]|jgi:hypothetical protein|nr:hypothetical protein [Candidatus Adiutrix sp.]